MVLRHSKDSEISQVSVRSGSQMLCDTLDLVVFATLYVLPMSFCRREASSVRHIILLVTWVPWLTSQMSCHAARHDQVSDMNHRVYHGLVSAAMSSLGERYECRYGGC